MAKLFDFSSTDFIAVLMILGYIFLVSIDKSTEIASAFLLIVGYYFGKKNEKMNNGTLT